MIDLPLVSVGVFCHNHEKFIEHTLASVFGQQTTYNVEVIVLDDASEDASIEIIQRWSKSHDNIIVVTNEKNGGPVQQAKKFAAIARGKYLCWLDADDRWIYKNKLQEQLDFLESNPDYVGCFHDAAIISDAPEGIGSSEYLMRFHNHWKTYSQFNTYSGDFFPWDALSRKIIPTASLLFRKANLELFFKKFGAFRLSISWAIHLWLLKESKFKYFNEVWSEYHDHPEGFSKKYSLIDFKINNIKMLETLLQDEYYSNLVKDVFKALEKEYFHLLSLPDIKNLRKSEFKAHLKAYKKYAKLATNEELNYFKTQYQSKH